MHTKVQKKSDSPVFRRVVVDCSSVENEGTQPLRHTACLFAVPNLFNGVARFWDFGATLNQYNYSETPEAADYFALLNDWLAVGGDIQWAIEQERESMRKSDKPIVPR